MTDQTKALLPVTPEDVDAALATFDGGLVRQNDERNARGYTTFYHPKDSMRAVLEEFLASRISHSIPGDVGKASASILEASWDIAFATFPESPDAFKAGVLAARIQTQFAALRDGMTRAEVHTHLDMVEAHDNAAALTPSAPISDATKRMEQTLGMTFQSTPSALSDLQRLGQEFDGEWQPRIGDEVRASESFLTRYGEWRDVPLFVAGICKDRGVPGLNVSVSEKWPVDLNSDGYTDGFYIGRDHCPDDLVPIAFPSALSGDAGEGECHGLDTPERICFYEQDFYVLSNFSSFTLYWNAKENMRFDTSEAAYHWEKFPDHDDIRFEIINAPSAHEAFKIAERNKIHRRADWDAVKVGIMRDILRAKVAQHEYVRRKLLATGDRELVENSWRDDYWGWGPNRDGQNMLGKLWMEVRGELRAALPSHQGAE